MGRSERGTVYGSQRHLKPTRPARDTATAATSTGYNAALIGALIGDSGRVVTIDVDEDLVSGAREHLAAAQVSNVKVVLGDGALGHPADAPYDRMIATVAFDIPTAWMTQLAPAGRMVVPVRLAGAASRSIIFERGVDGWTSGGSALAVFMPLRGIGDDARRLIALADGVTLQVHQDQDVAGQYLGGVLAADRHEGWTGVARRTSTTTRNRSHDEAASAGLATNDGVGSPMASGALKAATTVREGR